MIVCVGLRREAFTLTQILETQEFEVISDVLRNSLLIDKANDEQQDRLSTARSEGLGVPATLQQPES
jgi:hypothetical protein